MIFDFLSAGLDVFLSPLALGLTFAGIIVGLIVGAMPGLGPLMGIILLLPVAIGLPPVAAMGFLIAIFVGGSCGGSISAILLRIPGTPLAAATLYDGYPLAQKGRASDAIDRIAITSSAIGGLIGGVVLVFCAPILASFAANFAPPEYAMLAVLGLFAIVVISGGSIIKRASGGKLWATHIHGRNGLLFNRPSLHVRVAQPAERISYRGRCRGLVRDFRDGRADDET